MKDSFFFLDKNKNDRKHCNLLEIVAKDKTRNDLIEKEWRNYVAGDR